MIIRAPGSPDLRVAVAEPGPLIAMKLQLIMNRGAAIKVNVRDVR